MQLELAEYFTDLMCLPSPVDSFRITHLSNGDIHSGKWWQIQILQSPLCRCWQWWGALCWHLSPWEFVVSTWRGMAEAKCWQQQCWKTGRCWRQSADRAPWEFVPYQLTQCAITLSLGFHTGWCARSTDTAAQLDSPMLPMPGYQEPSEVGYRMFCSLPIWQTVCWDALALL